MKRGGDNLSVKERKFEPIQNCMGGGGKVIIIIIAGTYTLTHDVSDPKFVSCIVLCRRNRTAFQADDIIGR
jgi:hypothetical protein